jgi:hypothetical protein
LILFKKKLKLCNENMLINLLINKSVDKQKF